jgi:hypothetical protein
MHDFYSDYKVRVKQLPADADVMLKIEETKPDYLFTATSYTSDIELKFLCEAKKAGIPTFAFVDHYTRFKDRFTWKGKRVTPDQIFVIDDEAANIAIESGITAPLVVTGNFFHVFLERWKPKVKKDDFFIELGIPNGNKLFVFAPDPISNVSTMEDFGFDEVVVWKHLSAHLSKRANKRFSVVINMHPNQNKQYLLSQISKQDMHVIVGSGIHTNTLLYHSDVIFGMFSNILIESLVMKKRVIRYMVGLKKEDPFAERGVGEVAYSNQELKKIISTI